MKDTLEQLFYFGLGSMLFAKEKMEQASESSRGFREDSERKAREFFERAEARGTEERERVKESMKSLLKEAVDELGLATAADVMALRVELEALRAELARVRQEQL